MFKKGLIETPLGPLVGVASEEELCLLEFADRHGLEDKLKRLFGQDIAGGNNQILDCVDAEIQQYFLGKLRTFTIPICFRGTPFQVRVWQELLKIPYGTTISYTQLAKNTEKPTAFRAVAGANGSNNLAIVIPCHRVIYANGKLGGYSGGLSRKPRLLAVEMPKS